MLERLREFWGRLSQNQRILLGSLGAAFVALMIFVMTWAAKPEYAVLYANLETADASVIVDRLRGDNVPYEVDGGGGTIKVPQDRVHDLRLSLAADGLPSSGTGYELLDSSKLGWTDFVQKFQHRRALEGEIARTIQTLAEIQSARVHLVIPEPSLFIEEEKPATASVVLQLKSGARVQPGQIAGIVHLVSSAVEGLSPDQVTLLDTAGHLLSAPNADPLLGVSSDQLALVQKKEEEMTEKVQSLLETVLGRGKSVTRIAVEMDFEKTESTIESFDADNPVVRSETTTNATGQTGEKTETGTTNYEISKRIEHKTKPAGLVSRITASVFVDGNYEDGPNGEKVYVPRTDEEMAKFQNIIRTAIGFDDARGDQLTVENIAFDNSAEEDERRDMVNSQRMQMLLQVAGRVGSIALVGLVLFMAVRMVRRSQLFNPPPPVEVEPEVLDKDNPLLVKKPKEAEIMRGRIVELARQKPEEVSRILRTWLREEAS
ncbi:MAG: flagellar M-ring protein FliF [Candidatus Eisenbacteria bacterium]|uniref:Flagellar M-ring protein n=1 Tax=Eiseniibacteriota bacterium TaxID=2212470 RepID=A0A956N845_UNCEI|nr:flagellar M-ring protein FliF [Candidatus Eisenbacteria bacterium]